MAAEFLSTDHLNYLLRAEGMAHPLPPGVPATFAPFALRRSLHVQAVGHPRKGVLPISSDSRREAPRPTETEGYRGPLEPSFIPLSRDLLIALHGRRAPLAFVVRGAPSGVTLHLGTWADAADEADARIGVLRAGLEAIYPGVTLGEVAPEHGPVRPLPLAGFVMGAPAATPDFGEGAMPQDRLIRALAGTTWTSVVVAEPVEDGVVALLRDRAINEARLTEGGAMAANVPSPLSERYSELLDQLASSLTTGQSLGAWRTAVYLMGDEAAYERLAALWRGVFSGDPGRPEPVRVWPDPAAASLAARWALPDAPAPAGPGSFRHPYGYQTLLNSLQLAAYVHLPHLETAGFSVNAQPLFDSVPSTVPAGDRVRLGGVTHRGRATGGDYHAALTDLTRHAFVAGVTGAGKTNTILQLLTQADAHGVPFLVIEPAKTEYRALLNAQGLREAVQVFTLGNETASPFRLNPFEVPPGIPVGTHIDLLRSAFTASFAMWAPLPQILERCLHEVYAERGWDIVTNRNRRVDDLDRLPSEAFPTLADLALKADEITAGLGYGPEITGNIRAALLTRLNGLRAGGKGRMLDTPASLPMGLLMERPTVLELEGLGDEDDRAFVMGLLFIRLVEHWRPAGSSPRLRHLLVIEEAHRLLENLGTSGTANAGQSGGVEGGNPRAKAVEAFANLLAEIRAYGQGVIVADQSPTKLAPEVLKGTSLKIAHRVVEAGDRAALAGSMAMTEAQSVGLTSLPRGRAAVFAEGEDAPLLVDVENLKDRLGLTWPDNDRVRAHMDQAHWLDSCRSLFMRHPGCTATGPGGEEACREARALADVPLVRDAMARLVLTRLVDPHRTSETWADVVIATRSCRTGSGDEPQLLACLAAHSAERFSARRGAQGRWSFNAGARVREGLRRALTAEARGKATGAEWATVGESFLRAEQASSARCPSCAVVHGEAPCVFRGAVRDAVHDGRWQAAWAQAFKQDPAGGRIPSCWEVCKDAAFEMLEFPPEDWTVGERLARGLQVQRAGLCFAQHMLAADPLVPVRQQRATMQAFVEGANQ